MAVGDSVLQQPRRPRIASKISARMGEGVLNGLLTAAGRTFRACQCARPAPFHVEKRPGVADGRAVPIQRRQGRVRRGRA